MSEIWQFFLIYINGSYIWKSDFSWDLKVFNSKTVTSISFLEVQKLHVLFPSFTRSSSSLPSKRKKYIFKSLIWADHSLNLRWTTFKAIMLTITHLVWFRCLLYFNMLSEEPTSNNIQWYQVKSAPGHFDTYLDNQIGTYPNRNLVISAPNVLVFLFNYVWLTQLGVSDVIVIHEIVNTKWFKIYYDPVQLLYLMM